MELIVEVRDAEEGGYCARGVGLCENVKEAVALHFEDETERPRAIRLRYVKE